MPHRKYGDFLLLFFNSVVNSVRILVHKYSSIGFIDFLVQVRIIFQVSDSIEKVV